MKLLSSSEAETRDIGRRLGEKLKPGDIVCLYGELGSGKTVMVKGIASAFGIRERDITSASFTIIAEYDTPVPFYHIDLYRLNNHEAAELGLQDYIGGSGISVIEWAERAGSEIPSIHISVNFRHVSENVREIEIEGTEL
ncbi:MAG: tRNA (adenosine(37)-N6)-threonylcarbamoyltransferase complex ATPase subunit type 1 TsaE [Nitrospiraceae bacterium]|nr:MAG: tRNA (adenosine(37)-N6)-threonylcarbamoyltransferase complex ATPase subunit type 1 TsaE [Nitrospiraceae bacterium]